MAITRFSPPIDYLLAASRSSLQSYELTRLNHAANLRNEIAALLDQWVQETTEALLARWMLDHHESLQHSAMSPEELVRSLTDPTSVLVPECPSATEPPPGPRRYMKLSPDVKASIAQNIHK